MKNINQDKDFIGIILTTTLLILIIITGIISYKSIDWTVLKRVESQKLILPTVIPSQQSPTATPSSNSSKATK